MFIAYKQGTYARHLATDLKVPRINATEPGKILPLGKRRGYREMSIYVNWGCSPQLLQRVPKDDRRVLNADNSFTSSKLKTFDVLEAKGLPFPRITHDPKADDFYKRGKYLGRIDRLKGGKGIDIYERGQLPPDDAKHDFYSQVISKAFEVRFHLGRNEDGSVGVICEQVKYIPQGSGVLIRNYENGARFSNKRIEKAGISDQVAAKGREIAVAALDACGMDFAAIDMCLSKRGDWFIFELNSAPGIKEVADEVQEVDPDMPDAYTAYLDYFKQFIKE